MERTAPKLYEEEEHMEITAPKLYQEEHKEIAAILPHFSIDGELVGLREYGSGHINATYLAEMKQNGETQKYILQRINTDIFKNTDHLMANVTNVTSYLTKQIQARGGDPNRETLQVIPVRNGGSYYKAPDGCYRMYRFITDATSFEAVEQPEDFYESAVAFGNFQAELAQYPAETLYETIPDFHNTPKRYDAFCQALLKDCCGRAALAQPEIIFVQQREQEMGTLTELLAQNKLPLRVTHNDTKLNNIMIDNTTRRGICIIDLDTVMPGLSLYDFGDSIRFGANTAPEDETDLSKVSLSLPLYEQYVKGYLEGCRGSLTSLELSLLPMGAKLMTLECGMRFLTDYLSGDTYFKIHRENHNLDRCRTQFALVADMERKWQQMEDIIKKYC